MGKLCGICRNPKNEFLIFIFSDFMMHNAQRMEIIGQLPQLGDPRFTLREIRDYEKIIKMMDQE